MIFFRYFRSDLKLSSLIPNAHCSQLTQKIIIIINNYICLNLKSFGGSSAESKRARYKRKKRRRKKQNFRNNNNNNNERHPKDVKIRFVLIRSVVGKSSVEYCTQHLLIAVSILLYFQLSMRNHCYATILVFSLFDMFLLRWAFVASS